MDLIKKYNVPGPRYTSYPTVPYWREENFSAPLWYRELDAAIKKTDDLEGISLYIHLPFCESLCTFCACNKHITRNHEVEVKYIEYLLKEWQLVRSRMKSSMTISELHLGGGTPTFFSPDNLRLLIQSIMDDIVKPDEACYSFEGHPNSTTPAHLEALFDLGFDRASFGVQDYSEKVQMAINRIQSYRRVAQVTHKARQAGFTSVTHDLIFGLPFQTPESMNETISKTLRIRPDRIAFYSYAHVPWVKGSGQRAYNTSDLPDSHTKRRLYENGKQRLLNAGYIEIGMDHFALPEDRLYKALEATRLHRNFMGYTENHTNILIGLGVSAISDCWTAFSQNAKTVRDYCARLDRDEAPILRGHLLSDEDLTIRRHILNLMCGFETRWHERDLHYRDTILRNLNEFEKDQLVEICSDRVRVTPKGKTFIRNICMAFDLHMMRDEAGTRLYSMTV